MSSMKNIAFFSQTYLPEIGGVQFQLYWLFQEIDDHWEYYQKQYGIDNLYFITEDVGENKYLRFKHIKVITFPFAKSGKLRYFKLLQTILKIVKEKNITHMHASHAFVEAFIARVVKLFTGMRYMVTSWGQDFAYDKKFNYGARLSKKIEWIMRFNIKGADYITTISEDMCNFVREVIPAEKVKLVYCAKEYHAVTFDSDEVNSEIRSIRSELDILEDRTVCLTLSGSRKIKGHENMMLAFAQAQKEQPELLLLIGGHGKEIDEMKELSERLDVAGAVRFIGYIKDLRKQAFMTLSDIYLNTAFFEPFGLVYVQAIENRIAVVGSKHGGARDIFRHKETGYLIDPYSVQEIVEGICFFMDKERRHQIVEAAMPELKRFECSTIVHQYMELFSQMPTSSAQ